MLDIIEYPRELLEKREERTKKKADIKEIVRYPNKILRQKTKKVTDIQNDEFQRFVSEMKQTMLKADGLGLAATQVGSQLRIAIVNMKNGPEVIINPRIYLKALFKRSVMDEGCLSFPGIYGLIKRPAWVKLRYYDHEGNLKKIKAEGLLSTVVQHELDHLKGVLFIDKIFKYSKGEKKAKELMKQAKLDER